MSALITADLHLSDNPRDAYRLRWFEKLPALTRELGADRVLVLGDITEAKDAHRARLVNQIVDGFVTLAEVARVYVLRGNHDYLAEDVPFYRFLRHLDRVRWVNKPTPLRLPGLGSCLFLPHTHDLGEWAATMGSKYDWYFCHQTFGGADLGHGHLAVGGAAPFTRRAGDRVISGDVHKPQQLGPITYVGAPYTIDFGDDYGGEPRVLLLEGTKMRSVPVPGPQKRLIEMRWPEDFSRMRRDQQPGDLVKIRVELAPGSDVPRAQVRETARAWAAEAGVELCGVQVVAPEARFDAAADRARARPQDADLVRTYAKKMGKGKVTVATGLKIVEEIT